MRNKYYNKIEIRKNIHNNIVMYVLKIETNIYLIIFLFRHKTVSSMEK